MKRNKKAYEEKPENRDRKRDKEGWKASLRNARKAKESRRDFESVNGFE